jgi:1-deoxy-D-xylulose-5-phosphate reductoisomerase
LNFVELKELTFERPDLKKFPSLALALDVARTGGTLPAVLNAADEVAVESFLNGRIRFTQVYDVVAEVVADHRSVLYSTVEEVLRADQWARERAVEIIEQQAKV